MEVHVAHWSIAGYLPKTLESVTAVNAEAGQRRAQLTTVIGKVFRYPLKMAVLFVASPILLFLIAKSARKSLLQRVIAAFGLLLGIGIAVAVFLFMRTLSGALLMLIHFGVLGFLGFLLGTTLSIVITVAFCLWLLLLISWVFLHMSSEDIVDALKDAAADAR